MQMLMLIVVRRIVGMIVVRIVLRRINVIGNVLIASLWKAVLGDEIAALIEDRREVVFLSNLMALVECAHENAPIMLIVLIVSGDDVLAAMCAAVRIMCAAENRSMNVVEMVVLRNWLIALELIVVVSAAITRRRFLIVGRFQVEWPRWIVLKMEIKSYKRKFIKLKLNIAILSFFNRLE